MGREIELNCRCGRVRGWVRGVAPSTVNRAICYCDDCQAFLHHLGRPELMDERGGTDIVQVAPRSVRFEQGMANIAAVRLSPRGMHRWYATCCKTPLGNTQTPALPFIGIPRAVFPDASGERSREAVFGPVRGAVLGQYAIGGPPPGSTRLPLRLIARTARLLLGWKLSGKAWPHPFFERTTQQPRYPVQVLSTSEREALRPSPGSGGSP